MPRAPAPNIGRTVRRRPAQGSDFDTTSATKADPNIDPRRSVASTNISSRPKRCLSRRRRRRTCRGPIRLCRREHERHADQSQPDVTAAAAAQPDAAQPTPTPAETQPVATPIYKSGGSGRSLVASSLPVWWALRSASLLRRKKIRYRLQIRNHSNPATPSSIPQF